MKQLWNNRWKNALIWLCGYVHLIAFAVVGGFVVFKTADRELHKTAKTVFIVTLVFTAVEALVLILSGIASLGANMGTAISWIGFFVTLAKIGVYAAGVIMALFSGSDAAGKEKPAAHTESEPSEEEKTDGGNDPA